MIYNVMLNCDGFCHVTYDSKILKYLALTDDLIYASSGHVRFAQEEPYHQQLHPRYGLKTMANGALHIHSTLIRLFD